MESYSGSYCACSRNRNLPFIKSRDYYPAFSTSISFTSFLTSVLCVLIKVQLELLEKDFNLKSIVVVR